VKHSFSVFGELDAPTRVTVAVYLDCEHYVFLHQALSNQVEVLEHEGYRVTVRQDWRALGLTLGHIKDGTYIPPYEFHIENVRPSPRWVPSIHHFIGITTHLTYWDIAERDSTGFRFDVALDLPFWLYPFRRSLQRLIEKMHEQKNVEDMALIKRRERLFGRGNIAAYLAEHQFLYHKDAYVRHFAPRPAAR
jgi:hypothetical protein